MKINHRGTENTEKTKDREKTRELEDQAFDTVFPWVQA
jgi:hypothetical protein